MIDQHIHMQKVMVVLAASNIANEQALTVPGLQQHNPALEAAELLQD